MDAVFSNQNSSVESDGDSLWLIGVIISIVGSILSNFGLNVQKFGQMKNEKLPKEEQKSYVKQPLWWSGLILVIVGSLGDFVSLSFAPQVKSISFPFLSKNFIIIIFFFFKFLGEIKELLHIFPHEIAFILTLKQCLFCL